MTAGSRKLGLAKDDRKKKKKDNRVRKMRAVVIDESANRKKSSAVSQVPFCHVTLTSLANKGKHRWKPGRLTER